MEDIQLLELKITELREKLKKSDEERELNFNLEELREEHRSLPSPQSQTILFLVRKVFVLIQETNRQKKIIRSFEQAEADRERMKKRTLANG